MQKELKELKKVVEDENKNTKKEIVKMLLNQNLETEEEEDLINMLFDNNIAIDVDKEDLKSKKKGDKIADKITSFAGSWTFIIGFFAFLLLWILLNITLLKNVDPYPFILLNLLLSCLAAFQAPIILMSQNREAKKDSLRNKNDYKVDLKSELILEELHKEIKELAKNQRRILKIIDIEEEKQDK